MNTVLVVTSDEELRASLLRVLEQHSTFEATSDTEALRTLRRVEIDVVLRDAAGAPDALGAFLAEAREAAPATLTIAVGVAPDEDHAADFAVPPRFTSRELERVLHQAFDKQRLLREVSALRRVADVAPAITRSEDEPLDGATLARALKGFAGVFAGGFDLQRVLDMFLGSLGELVQTSRAAVLLPETPAGGYRIAASRGYTEQVVQSLRLGADEGLARWLSAEGRLAAIGEVSQTDVVRDLQILQGTVAVPLQAHGELVGILVLGPPILGAGYGRRQMQALFDLATHLAAAIRDIDLHQQLRREKEFSERILSHMASGVVTIDRAHRIGIFNRRAEEILRLPASTVIGQDLRALPSPLGDLLYDTLASGRAHPREERQIALHRLWLEVSTYAIHDEAGAPLGAVLVFEDLTAQKELSAQRRQAEELELLTRVVARIADEIKNPLVSINTFIELIGERYDDPDFRKHFASVVRRDVRRLVEVFEKLAGLVTEGEVHFATVDAHAIVTHVVDAIDLADEEPGAHVQFEVDRDQQPQPVRADGAQLRKALSYLIRYLAHNSPGEVAKIAISVGPHEGPTGPVVRILIGSRTATVAADKLERLFDPVHMVQESLVDVGPAVSQRLIEAQGGHLRLRQGRHELGFLVTLPAATS
jgi:PAS domain S-box-containing protein